MPLTQRPVQTQRLVMTQQMQLSLRFLQLPAQELGKLLEEEALSNPVLEVEASYPAEGGKLSDFTDFFTRPPSYTEHLNEQLGQMRELDAPMLARCRYLVGCLNESGYLDCPLSELAVESRQSLGDMEQALFVVQTLDPIGTGARSLGECLLLQLAQGKHFNEANIHLIKSGLPLLAKGDEAGLAKLLKIPREGVRRSMEAIRALNPIPSRGFYTENDAAMLFPEAVIRTDGGELTIEMNRRALPDVTLNEAYLAMLKGGADQETEDYLKEKTAAAREILSGLKNRQDTMLQVLRAVVRVQRAHFLSDAPLEPLTMQHLAEELGLSVSTVSRAVKDKYIQFHTQILPLRRFFTAALNTEGGETISAAAARQKLAAFVAAEEKTAPLSDSALEKAFSGLGMTISRRTIAKYRAELGIPTAAQRKKK